jgi:hypothetical protein
MTPAPEAAIAIRTEGTGRQVTADNRSITHVPLCDACFADGEDLGAAATRPRAS